MGSKNGNGGGALLAPRLESHWGLHQKTWGEAPTDKCLNLGDTVNSQENFSKEQRNIVLRGVLALPGKTPVLVPSREIVLHFPLP